MVFCSWFWYQELFLWHGADPGHRDDSNRSALDYARLRQPQALAALEVLQKGSGCKTRPVPPVRRCKFYWRSSDLHDPMTPWCHIPVNFLMWSTRSQSPRSPQGFGLQYDRDVLYNNRTYLIAKHPGSIYIYVQDYAGMCKYIHKKIPSVRQTNAEADSSAANGHLSNDAWWIGSLG